MQYMLFKIRQPLLVASCPRSFLEGSDKTLISLFFCSLCTGFSCFSWVPLGCFIVSSNAVFGFLLQAKFPLDMRISAATVRSAPSWSAFEAQLAWALFSVFLVGSCVGLQQDSKISDQKVAPQRLTVKGTDEASFDFQKPGKSCWSLGANRLESCFRCESSLQPYLYGMAAPMYLTTI